LSSSFFSALPAIERFQDVVDPANHHAVPDDWDIVVADVAGSTKAIEDGRYKDVNALGVACIAAIRNAVPDIELPFVFGGDGATLLTPSSEREAVLAALSGTRHRSEDCFDMKLHAGVVPIKTLVDGGHPVAVARYRLSEKVVVACLSGSGVTVAEKWIKARDPRAFDPEPGGSADFSGFECRWIPVKSRHGQVVSLLVQAGDPSTYAELVDRLERVTDDAANPVHPSSLVLSANPKSFTQEARLLSGARSGLKYGLALLQAVLLGRVGATLLSLGLFAAGFPGATYRDQVTAHTDFRKFDEILRMVLDLSDAQLSELQAWLSARQAEGKLIYGLHQAPASLMTCLIDEHDGVHFHFVDGADGGYALAAKSLKAALATS